MTNITREYIEHEIGQLSLFYQNAQKSNTKLSCEDRQELISKLNSVYLLRSSDIVISEANKSNVPENTLYQRLENLKREISDFVRSHSHQ